MKKLTKLSGIATLVLALSAAGAAAWAAPETAKPDAAKPDIVKQKQPMPMAQFPHGGPGFPPPAPLYEASLQTHNPDEALNKLIANAPRGEGKNYEVKVMVRELPPAPFTPSEQAGNQ
ncbi:hypothetical protein HC231_05440 [Brenneria izadpanahii]|uniref:Uncharacterized protein n=1 Tax=Brenneria izadpanahii TaxID=2722756 RepID=A0ABX7URB6_9GAMM|nr:hypothetical protein [Brenneria izadpanahii]QTF07426.1 hypothetical protein HC231_05440 [Brenneria izadpanahii]